MVEIRYNDQYEVTDLAGCTVSEARAQFSDEFGVPAKARVKLNGSKVKTKAEADTIINDDDKLSFAVSRGKGAYLIGAMLLALIITGSTFAFGFINGTTTISSTVENNFADVIVSGNFTSWTAWGNHKGSIGDGGIFRVEPDNTYTGDLVVTVGFANAAELIERYKVLSMQIQLLDAADNTTILDINGGGGGVGDGNDWVMLTLNNGEVSMYPSAAANITVNIKSGFYITHVKPNAGWGAGGDAAPDLICEVAQR